ncbi:hypothetical protein L6452_03134 [Arctium lappa]|uniref:Uncharacterized protein n=1 Tax=Arctium lappa TaxID=4217 RepID=A0ACB9FLB8_ARCLA|nr:hypothetical protein L6452_03134 [Arctium lappa]
MGTPQGLWATPKGVLRVMGVQGLTIYHDVDQETITGQKLLHGYMALILEMQRCLKMVTMDFFPTTGSELSQISCPCSGVCSIKLYRSTKSATYCSSISTTCDATPSTNGPKTIKTAATSVHCPPTASTVNTAAATKYNGPADKGNRGSAENDFKYKTAEN